MTADTLVEARWVIPVIPRNTVLENHTVVFSGGRIADILPTEAARVRYAGLEAKTMRLPAGVVMPGLINLHTHAAMNLLRGRGADLPLMDWLTKEIWPAEGRLMSAEFVHDGSLIAGVEMIRSGVTCCSDLYFFPEAAAEGLREAGLRDRRHRHRLPVRLGRERRRVHQQVRGAHRALQRRPVRARDRRAARALYGERRLPCAMRRPERAPRPARAHPRQ